MFCSAPFLKNKFTECFHDILNKQKTDWVNSKYFGVEQIDK